ncbi:hypothetical protein PUMCH_005190 [Australozyma saopauloensis]|uniref:Mitochondrial group I intron splicing factor CCM1 n=1 Tax=Australozyma saopauloensis TaxID=291208 RepID=A0AAX4HH04_9ASCO|nr:hypothetical protein PUMCH_005190 [[Candida] saopauloensis]
MLRSRSVLRLCQTIPRRANLVRFQVTSTVVENDAKRVPPPKNAEAANQNSQKKNHFQKPIPRNPNKPFSRKFRDISQQISVSVKDANATDLTEAIDIYEEGLSYLREIQAAEKIEDELMYREFQRSATILLGKAIQSGDEKLISRVLEIFIANRVAHNFHFAQYLMYLLGQGAERHTEILSLWLQYLEYSKMLDATTLRLLNRPFGFQSESKFLSNDLMNVTYFVFVLQCAAAGVELQIKDAMKLLQITDASRLPPTFQVMSSLRKCEHFESIRPEVEQFSNITRNHSIKLLNPNGEAMAAKIYSITKNGNYRMLKQYYERLSAASVENNLPLTEDTLNRVMNAFIELHHFSEALEVFTTMASSFKPSATSWTLAIKAMGHPKHVDSLKPVQKDKMVQTVKSTLQSMEAMGVPVNAKVLAVAVGAMANLDKQEEVQKLLSQYSNIPVVHLTRHNNLLGMILNNDVAEAEKRMKEYFKEDPTYVPSIQLLNSFLTHYVNVANYNAADAMLQFMSEKNIESDLGTITTVVNYYFKSCKNNGRIPDVHTVLLELTKKNLKWDPNMAATLMNGLTLDSSNLDAVRAVFKFFIALGPRFKNSPALYTSMIQMELDHGDVALAEDLFLWYDENLKSDTRAWNQMIKGLLVNNEKRAVKFYQKMVTHSKNEPNNFTFYYMLIHFLKTGNTKRVQWVLDEMAASSLADFGLELPSKVTQLKLQYNVDQSLLRRLSSEDVKHARSL